MVAGDRHVSVGFPHFYNVTFANENDEVEAIKGEKWTFKCVRWINTDLNE